MNAITRSALFVSALTWFSFGAPGCAMESEPRADGPSTSLSRHSFCAQSVCDKILDDCMDYIDECFGQCYAMSAELAYQCVSVCNNHQCSTCIVDECDSQGYDFEVTAPRDPKVFDACGRFEAKALQCGADTSTILCDRFSRLARRSPLW